MKLIDTAEVERRRTAPAPPRSSLGGDEKRRFLERLPSGGARLLARTEPAADFASGYMRFDEQRANGGDASPAARRAPEAPVSSPGRTGVLAVQLLHRGEDLSIGEDVARADDQGRLAV